MTIINGCPVSQKVWYAKESSLLNGHECRAWLKFCSPWLVMVTSPYEWKILEGDDKLQTNKQKNQPATPTVIWDNLYNSRLREPLTLTPVACGAVTTCFNYLALSRPGISCMRGERSTSTSKLWYVERNSKQPMQTYRHTTIYILAVRTHFHWTLHNNVKSEIGFVREFLKRKISVKCQ